MVGRKGLPLLCLGLIAVGNVLSGLAKKIKPNFEFVASRYGY